MFSAPTMYRLSNELNRKMYFYNSKAFFGYIQLKQFFTNLNNAIVNDLPIAKNVKIDFPTFKRDHSIIPEYANADFVRESYDLYLNIINNLENAIRSSTLDEDNFNKNNSFYNEAYGVKIKTESVLNSLMILIFEIEIDSKEI
jgi:hypothetical protein